MRITVLTGGTSSERDVAIASAVQVVRALRSRGHAVAVVDTAGGYIPEAAEPQLLNGSVGREPPRLEELVALERGVLLSSLSALPVVRVRVLKVGHEEDVRLVGADHARHAVPGFQRVRHATVGQAQLHPLHAQQACCLGGLAGADLR